VATANLPGELRVGRGCLGAACGNTNEEAGRLAETAQRGDHIAEVAVQGTPYVYDPELGDPDNGIPPGTPLEDLPDDWLCPECVLREGVFEPLV
jgi:rubredoxin